MSQTLVVCIPPDTPPDQAREVQQQLGDADLGVRVVVIAANNIAVIDDGLVEIDDKLMIGSGH